MFNEISFVYQSRRERISSDPARLRQCVQGLLVVACKQTQGRTITVEVSDEGASVRVRIGGGSQGEPVEDELVADDREASLLIAGELARLLKA